MTEQALKDYFEGKLSVGDLSRDVHGSQIRTGQDTTSVRAIQLTGEEEFKVTRVHMLMLCNDAIASNISTEDLNTISFALMTSEHFMLNDGTADGEIVSATAFDWDNPEIGYALTPENLKHWKTRLETGADNFDKSDLKRQNK
ncbi:MAG: hypothetical protein IPH00_07530 [Flavobacteriales bacterium]|nr:hypothetical protein [Flavobacteriales bacterium]